MTRLEIIDALCSITEQQSKIIRKQQEIIDRSEIEAEAARAIRKAIEQSDKEVDCLEYHLRRICDIDDVEKKEGERG